MKNTIPRTLISAMLLALVAGIVVSIIGLVLRWNTAAQYSDGFFLAGAILISIGLVSVLGARSGATGLQYSQSAARMNSEDRVRLWATDLTHSYHILAFLGISGLLLFGLAGLAILVGRVF